jgi:hypothetical protein
MSKREQTLGELLKADRLKRKNAKGKVGMSWPEYAAFLGMPMTTVYKIAQGTHSPREVTAARIRERLRKKPAEETPAETAATDADVEVVQVRE